MLCYLGEKRKGFGTKMKNVCVKVLPMFVYVRKRVCVCVKVAGTVWL